MVNRRVRPDHDRRDQHELKQDGQHFAGGSDNKMLVRSPCQTGLLERCQQRQGFIFIRLGGRKVIK
jgi:hypothetical protein